nr:hypothetical protein [Tanacetum cinerariifolium]
MILESFEHGPLTWPTIKENGVTTPRKYSELTPTEAIQAYCNIKATNVILQGLPPEERECKLYDKFNKFAYKKGETLCDFYLRFSLLLNDMNIYILKLEQFQVNIKFLNTLPPKWSKFVIDVKQQGDDLIDAINHMMSFLSAVVTSRYPTTNNQLRNSSNPRTYTPGASGSNSRKQRTVICYNYKGEGHISKQCTKPKRKRDDAWFKDKVLLVQAQANGQILHEEKLTFLADPEIEKVALMANLSHYGLDVLAEVHNPDNIDNNMINQSIQNAKIDRLKQTLSKQLQEKESLMKTVTVLENDFKKKESRNIDREIDLENKIKHLDNIVYKRDQSVQTIHMLTKPKFFYDHTTKQALGFQNLFLKKAQQLEQKIDDGNVIMNTYAIMIPDSEEALMLAEESQALKDELRKLKGKALVDNIITTHTIAPEMLKIDIEPLAPRLLNNRTGHSNYLRLTQEQAMILREVVEQGKSQNPLNNSLDSTCKYTK